MTIFLRDVRVETPEFDPRDGRDGELSLYKTVSRDVFRVTAEFDCSYDEARRLMDLLRRQYERPTSLDDEPPALPGRRELPPKPEQPALPGPKVIDAVFEDDDED